MNALFKVRLLVCKVLSGNGLKLWTLIGHLAAVGCCVPRKWLFRPVAVPRCSHTAHLNPVTERSRINPATKLTQAGVTINLITVLQLKKSSLCTVTNDNSSFFTWHTSVFITNNEWSRSVLKIHVPSKMSKHTSALQICDDISLNIC